VASVCVVSRDIAKHIKREIHDKIEVGCLTTIKEEAAYDDVFQPPELISWPLFITVV
jgi:hypothetical protein